MALCSGLLAQQALAQSVQPLLGTWSGQGNVVLEGGKSEAIKCNSYVTGGGNELRYVIRCASTSYKIEIRSRLNHQGGQLNGQWEERTYNANGDATGRLSDGRITLAIKGGGFTGQMTVSYAAQRQTIAVSTQGIGMTSMLINLTKAGN